LTRLDRDLRVKGDLARSWHVSDDGLSITFHLRKGVEWHDGQELTAGDVEFTYTALLDKSNGCPYRASYSDISSIEVIDRYTVRFIYEKPYAPALVKFGMGIIPSHVYRGYADIRKAVADKGPVGTGPYMFSRWEPGEFIVLEANTGYFEHIPRIAYYVFRIVPDSSVQFLELVSGGGDSMELSPYQYTYRSRSDIFRQRINKYSYLSRSYTYIGYNLDDPVLSDIRIRKALSYAVDKKAIIEAVLLGQGEICTGPFLRDSVNYNSGVKGYPYDPFRARELLSEAGWVDSDGDGIVEKDGAELSIVIATNQGNKVRKDTAVIIQSQWRDIGVRAEIQVLAWAAFLDKFILKKKFQAVIMGWTLPVDPDPYNVWHSASSGRNGLNFISYSNARVDDLIEEGRRTFSPAERALIYKEIHELVSADAPYTFLFFPYSLPAVNSRFIGIDPAPAGIGYNFIDWYVPSERVRYRI
jgi:peptide/nickel transport system substrate-binding protein